MDDDGGGRGSDAWISPAAVNLKRAEGAGSGGGRRYRELQPRVGGDDLVEEGPAILVQGLEGVKIYRDDGGIVFFQEGGDGGFEGRFFGLGGDLLDGAVGVVLDAEAVEEIAEHRRVAADEPDLEEVCGDGLVLAAAQGVLEPGETLDARFALDEDGAEFALFRQVLDEVFVEGFLVLVDFAEQCGAGALGHLEKDVVGSHGGRLKDEG